MDKILYMYSTFLSGAVAVHDTSPPADQIITTTDSNQLLERFRALLKEKDARMLKRAGAEVGAARPDKRPKL